MGTTREMFFSDFDPPVTWRAQAIFLCVICERPTDFPDHYTMRLQCPYRGPDRQPAEISIAKWCGIYESLEEAREDLPPGAFNLGRQKYDTPCIKEVWVL